MSIRRPPGEEGARSILLVLSDRDVENIWVRDLGDGTYEVLTVPFWAYNLSRGDAVSVRTDDDGQGLFVADVVRKGGNRTLRVAFQSTEGIRHPEAQRLREYFDEHGLIHETFSPRMFSVNLPSQSDWDALVRRLESIPAEAGMIWEEADPNPRKNLDRSPRESGPQPPRP